MPRPPLALLTAYRVFGWRLGAAYRDWTYADITGPRYRLRQGLVLVLVGGLPLAAFFVAAGGDPRLALGLLALSIMPSLLGRDAVRYRALRQQGLREDGEPLAAWFADDRQRNRRNVTSAVLSTAVVVAALVLLLHHR